MDVNWGSELKEIRKEMGISQEKMAKLLGYSSKHIISRIESGNKEMSTISVKCVKFAYRLYKEGLLSKVDYM
jgi:transcriptional regulator with XRE-family HTH domain